ncbi:MAG: recombinase family protein [Myxococcales bacterium]|nr:recombinase family protein [Myxococcales bacterium]
MLVYARSAHHLGAAGQLRALRHVAAARGWLIAAEHVDFTSPGAGPRPQFERMLSEARQGGGGTVVATSLATLFVSQREAILVLRDFAVRGIGLVAQAEGIDSTVPGGCDLGPLMGGLVTLDRAALRERIALGLAEARRQGKPIGRKRVDVPVVQARELLSQGHSLRETGRRLGIAVATLHRALQVGGGAGQAQPTVALEAA